MPEETELDEMLDIVEKLCQVCDAVKVELSVVAQWLRVLEMRRIMEERCDED